jgi:hypothetical protein
MSFQAYLDNIQAKTGKTPDDFRTMAAEKGLVKTSDIVSWCKAEFGLGHGHAMAIVHLIVHETERNTGPDEKINKIFAGSRVRWRKSYDTLFEKINGFGPDVSIAPTQTYIGILRSGKKFAIIQPSSAEYLDIGIKFKGVDPAGRLEEAGTWNSMVTHRVRINDLAQIDTELMGWLKKAYDCH